jgi:hypothetical protein
VILRVVSGRVPPGQVDAVVEDYRRFYVPIAEATVGLERYVIGARPDPAGGHAIAAMTIWTSFEAAVSAFQGDLTTPRTLDARNHGETFTLVDFFEVNESGARREKGNPKWLRLTAGRVARGLDADIQQELRRHLPELPPEALEAFVGRRVRGADVEIALVTTWSQVPDGIALDAPIWPAISDRYDEFRIEVHEILLEGFGAP